MSAVFLSLGSNLGDKLIYLRSAIKQLENIEGNKILKLSSIYNTQPWGNPKQQDFLNIVIKISTLLSPIELFRKIKFIEKIVGRKNYEKWKSREIDIDILFYNDLVFNSKHLTIPHPEIPHRKFVLIPLNEIEPDFIHPVLKLKVRELLKVTKDKLNCEFYQSSEVLIN
ncbi:MAG: 2-amino-4-hydroxy-6-hydroxymethyldihydropteridine diphosphokinase [Ignavibacteria bacterium]|nr:2-amino-4-hydroxy-6-hydroxymethyldihydropteridine diphosphokinase [Ignavibacteria bacterium]